MFVLLTSSYNLKVTVSTFAKGDVAVIHHSSLFQFKSLVANHDLKSAEQNYVWLQHPLQYACWFAV